MNRNGTRAREQKHKKRRVKEKEGDTQKKLNGNETSHDLKFNRCVRSFTSHSCTRTAIRKVELI